MSKDTRQRSVEYVLGAVETLAIGLIWLEYKVHVGRKVGWDLSLRDLCSENKEVKRQREG